MGNRNVVAAILAIMALAGFLAVIVFLAFGKVSPENKDFFNMSLMALVGFVNISFGYYLGSSIGSSRKTELMVSPAINMVSGEELKPADLAKSSPPPGSAGFTRPLLLLILFILMLLILLCSCTTINPTINLPPTATGGTYSIQISADKNVPVSVANPPITANGNTVPVSALPGL